MASLRDRENTFSLLVVVEFFALWSDFCQVMNNTAALNGCDKSLIGFKHFLDRVVAGDHHVLVGECDCASLNFSWTIVLIAPGLH